jgi:eukaryotic-like serine/threonine-protein kinase
MKGSMGQTPQLLNKEVGKYLIMNEISRGGMGVIFLGKHTTLNRYAAVKMLFPHLAAETNFVKRFREEMHAMSKLKHPNIVDIYDYEEAFDTYFIIMEIVVGRSLESLMGEVGSLDSETAIQIVRQILQALAYAHKQGILHRDIKPSNIMITDQGMVKVLDFGIAKILGGENLTQTGFMVGTPQYISPEQAKGEDLSPGSDLYSVTAVLYEMLAGEPVFKAESPVALAMAHIKESPGKARKINPEISQAAEKILMKGLMKDPGKRFKSANEMIEALDRIHAPSETKTGKKEAVKKMYDQVAPTMIEGRETIDSLASIDPTAPTPPEFKIKKAKGDSWIGQTWAAFTSSLGDIRISKIAAIGFVTLIIAGIAWMGISPAGRQFSMDSWKSITSLFVSMDQEIVQEPVRQYSIPQTVPKAYGNILGIAFEVIPSGKFTMGVKSGSTGTLDDSPDHDVTLSSFLISRYEITNEEYAMFLQDTSYPEPPHWISKMCPEGKELYPVTNVSWIDAVTFCRWLSRKTGLVFRLPTEAEWERAAYSGGKYPWGDRWRTKSANVREAEYESSVPVGSCKADCTLSGLFDMGGNVREWILDYYSMSEYAVVRDKNPKGPSSGKKRVVRGGSYAKPFKESRVTRRDNMNPRRKMDDLGFRVVLQQSRNP